jgi:hypothetical protein
LLLGIAAARQPLPTRVCVVPLALFELIVPSYLLRGYIAPAFGNPVTGVAMEEPDRMLSELAATSRLASSTAGWCTPFGSATLPHKAYGSSTG